MLMITNSVNVPLGKKQKTKNNRSNRPTCRRDVATLKASWFLLKFYPLFSPKENTVNCERNRVQLKLTGDFPQAKTNLARVGKPDEGQLS